MVGILPGGTEFYPIAESAVSWASWMTEDFAAKKITKQQLTVTLDNSMSVDGPMPANRANKQKLDELIKKAKKVPKGESDKEEVEQTGEKSLVPVISIMDARLDNIEDRDWRNTVNFKAKSFLTDSNKSTFAYEIKRTRAVWDASLAIPGTDRRGGFRCPPGTRYGGQITDRFGRNCGWGVARRLANEIADLGERVENIDDRRRERRVNRRNERVARRLREGGRVERAARAIGNALESVTPEDRKPGLLERAAGRVAEALDTPNAPRKPARRQRRGANSQRRENIIERGARRLGEMLDSDQRDGGGQPAPRRPRPQAPQARPARPRQPRQPRPAAPEARPNNGRRPRPVRDNVSGTPVPAGAPRPDETLEEYKRRKYNEHQARIRKIRDNGGDAGFLRYDEWDKFHGPDIEENWNRAQERNRGRGARRAATDAGAARSASRRPTPADVPEPEQPPRRQRRPFNAPGQRGFASEAAARRRRVVMEREDSGNSEYRIVKHNEKYYVVKKQEVDRANANGANLEVVNEPPRPRRPKAQAANPAPAINNGDDLVPNDLKPTRQPRKLGDKNKSLDRIIVDLHENNGNLEDVKDGIVVDAVLDDEMFMVGRNGQRIQLDRNMILSQGFRKGGNMVTGQEFENRRYKFKFIKESNAFAGRNGVWEVVKVQDKKTGEIWYLKTSTYGQNDGLLENIGMRAAQALELGNDENHFRLNNLQTANGERQIRWMMMRDVNQWDHGGGPMRQKFKDAMDFRGDPSKVEPRDVARLAVMDFIFANEDRHRRNFQLGEDQQGRVRIAVIDNGLLMGGRVRAGNGAATPDELIARGEQLARQDVAAYRMLDNNAIMGLGVDYGIGYHHGRDQRKREIFAEQARRSAERLREQLDDILDAQRIEANGIQLSPTEQAHLRAVRIAVEGRLNYILNNGGLEDLVAAFNN